MDLKHLTTKAAALAAVLFGLGSISAQAAEIRVLNWKDYGTDAKWAVAAFKEKTGHTVVHDYFNSEQEMLTKLRTNPGAYDVVLINSAFTGKAIEDDLIEKIETSDMPNVADLAPNMAANPNLAPGGTTYGVAWVWGLTSIAINKNEVKPEPTSLQILWDEKYKGKVGWRDDALEAVQFAALATGQNINDIKDLDAVKSKLKDLMPQLKTYWSSENDWNQFLRRRRFRDGPLLEWIGRTLDHQGTPGKVHRSQGRRDRMAGRSVDPQGIQEPGSRPCVHQLHDRPGVLQEVGRQRRAGVRQPQSRGNASRRRS